MREDQSYRRIVVRTAMTSPAETVLPEETLQAAAARMRARNIGLLVVRDGTGRVRGVITDRDVTTRAVAEGLDPNGTPVKLAMTPQVFTCREEDDIAEAARIMEERAVRRLIVLGRDGRLAGVLSLDDVARILGDEALAGEVLGRVAEPSPPET